MPKFEHLIVGGGLAAYTAAQGVREVDEAATIGILSEEPEGPFDRTALSKSLWQGREEDDAIFDLAELGVELINRRAVTLDPTQRVVFDDSGERIEYGKVLLATGVGARRLPLPPSVHYLRSFEDYRRIRSAANDGRSFLVMGGGFLGAELAASLATVGNEVSMAFPEEGIGARVYPHDLSQHLNAEFGGRGVRVYPGQFVTEIAVRDDGSSEVRLSDGTALLFDEVVAAVGSTPRTELAQQAGLTVDDGIVVDEFFRTSAPDVYAAGDVASFPDPVLGRRRVEHEDHAMHSGLHAGKAMAGEGEPYRHLPLFYSDLFDFGYEAVGDLNSAMPVHSRWEEPFRKGIVYYLDETGSRVRGVLLWDTWGLVDKARDLISSGERVDPAQVRLE